MHHLFLTGEKQTGKSTILRKALAHHLHTGFYTEPFYIGETKRGYTFHSLTELPPMENDAPCVIRVGEMRHTAVEAVFENAGAQSLRQARESDAPIILMDELGKAERKAEGFLAEIRACLNDPAHHVVGVLQQVSCPMIEEIRAREDVQIITVTVDNREDVLRQVEEIIQQWEKNQR